MCHMFLFRHFTWEYAPIIALWCLRDGMYKVFHFFRKNLTFIFLDSARSFPSTKVSVNGTVLVRLRRKQRLNLSRSTGIKSLVTRSKSRCYMNPEQVGCHSPWCPFFLRTGMEKTYDCWMQLTTVIYAL